MILNLFRYFSLRYLFMHKLRTMLTFVGVSLGISLFLSILLLNDATYRSIDENIDSMTGKADLTVTSDGMGFEESVLNKVKANSKVKSAIPVVTNYAYLNDKDSDPILFLGIDLLKDSSVREYNTTGDEIIPDPLAFVNQVDSIIATRSWAKRQNLEMDSTIDLLTKDGKKTFTIRGLVDDVGPAKIVNGNLIIMDIDGARYNFGRDGLYDRIDLVLDEKNELESVKRELREMLGSRFKVEDKLEQSESMQQIIQSVKDVSGMLGTISFLIGFLIIVNTVNTAISQRRKDIGSLRAFGASKLHIIILFAGEFIFLAFLSSLLGAWIGYEIALTSTKQMAQGLNASLMTNVTNMKVIFTPDHFLAALSLGLLSSVSALLYPLYKALKIHPVDAIKPSTLDFSLSHKPKSLSWAALIGAIFFLLTIVGGEFSKKYSWLKEDEVQSLFLFTGITCLILLSPYLVLSVISLLHRLPLPFVLNFSLSNLLKNPARTASISIHLSLGFSLVLLVSSINISFRETILSWVKRVMSAENVVNVTSWGSISGLQVQPMHESIREELLKLSHLSSHPNPVAGVRIVSFNKDGKRYMIKAFDNPRDGERFHFIDPIEGSKIELGRKLYSHETPTLLMSETMLSYFGKKVGDKFILETPAGDVDFLIGGNIREFASPAGVIYLDRDVYKKLWNDPLVTVFSIFHDNKISSSEFRDMINPHLGEKYHLVANLPYKLFKEVETNLDNNMALSDSTKWIALFIGSLGLLNSFLIAIIQRFKELGCIRSIGMTKGQLITMVIVESASLGIVGVIIAFLTTLPISYVWVNHTLSYLLGWKVNFYFTGQDILLYFLIGVIISVLAGIIPARKAARLKLSEALQYE